MKTLIKIFLILFWAGSYSISLANEPGGFLIGNAGWYAKADSTDNFLHKTNADGTPFQETALTCAMRSRNFGHYYKITNLNNGKSVIVKHRDFGPARSYHGRPLNRIVDLSKAAFGKIADLKTGVIKVKVERLS